MTELATSMTLRDHFASQAMQGLIAAGSNCPAAVNLTDFAQQLAELAYLMADSMLQARTSAPERPSWPAGVSGFGN